MIYNETYAQPAVSHACRPCQVQPWQPSPGLIPAYRLMHPAQVHPKAWMCRCMFR
jgi:hypothetical protein